MGRRRIYQHYDVPGTVRVMIQAMIQDYPRRQRLIDANEDIGNEWMSLNVIIADIVNSCDPILNNIILSDIINARGYDRSNATNIASKMTYYNAKRKLIQDIAEKCNLL